MNDGDTLLVVADKTIIEVAERNMEGVVPLYYEMKKAEPVILNDSQFHKGMEAAWASGTIGPTSNNITKIWNRDVVGEDEYYAIKILAAEGNYQIDSAKTLYSPTRPPDVNEFLRQYTKVKMPYFFMDAKDYKRKQVEAINNSFVNKLRRVIKRKRLSFRKFDKFDYHKLLNNPDVIVDKQVVDKYEELAQKFRYRINNDNDNDNLPYLINDIKNKLLDIGYPEEETADILTKYLFSTGSESKLVLWSCFGEVLLSNLKKHLNPREIYCYKCGARFIPNSNNHKYCNKCLNEDRTINEFRTVICVDCGREFTVPKTVRNKKRCDECQVKSSILTNRKSSQNYRDKKAE